MIRSLAIGVTLATVALATDQHHHHHHRSHNLHANHANYADANHPMRFAKVTRGESDDTASTSDKTSMCFSKSEGPPGCCPKGSVDTGETEDCDDPSSHGTSYLGRHCKASVLKSTSSYFKKKLNMETKKEGWRTVCTADPAAIEKINKEKDEKQQVEQAMLAESQKQKRDEEIATAESILDAPASLALCKVFHSQANLCESVGCEFISRTKLLFGSDTVRCNFGCCPTKQARTGQSPTTAVCNSLKTKPNFCAEAGCLYHASAKMFKSGRYVLYFLYFIFGIYLYIINVRGVILLQCFFLFFSFSFLLVLIG